MSTAFGSKDRFAVEIGENAGGRTRMCKVDLWAANRWLTCDDNTVFIPQFRRSVQSSVRWLRSGVDLSLPFHGLSPADAHRRLLDSGNGSREQFWFFNWGPTTDNILAHVFRNGDRILIPFEFCREEHHDPKELGVVFVAELPEAEFLWVLEQMVAALAGNDEV